MSNSQLHKTLKQAVLKSGNFWQTVLLSLVATVIWQVFYPGLMSNDSINQYLQAALGSYTDWHPPLMSVTLSVFLKLGFGIGELILLQCYLAIFGLRNVISLFIEFFSNRLVSKPTVRTAATILTLLFLIPFLTPFMFFSVIFWKDAWLAIMLLWIISYLLWIFLNFDLFSKKTFFLHIFLLSLAFTIMISVRYNAFVMLPVFCIFVAMLGKIKFGNVGIAFAAVPLIFAFALNPVVNSVFNVKNNNIGNLVLANDFAIMLRLYPELETEYPLAAQNQFMPLPMICHKHEFIYWGIKVGEDNKDLKNEYAKALSKHRSKLLAARLYIFGQMLHPSTWWQTWKVHYGILENQYGLESNKEFTEIRSTLYELSRTTGNKWYFVWVSGMHIMWLVLNILCVIYSSIKVFIKKDRKSVVLFLLFLIPLSYYFSYVLAALSADYRYMYPSTLIMQVLISSLLASKMLMSLQKSIVIDNF